MKWKIIKIKYFWEKPKSQNKKEVCTVLSVEEGIYLPPISNVNQKYIRWISIKNICSIKSLVERVNLIQNMRIIINLQNKILILNKIS